VSDSNTVDAYEKILSARLSEHNAGGLEPLAESADNVLQQDEIAHGLYNLVSVFNYSNALARGGLPEPGVFDYLKLSALPRLLHGVTVSALQQMIRT